MIRDYFRFSLRNLMRRRLRSWLTMIGIIIGITAVVSLIGMGQGLQAAITSQFGDLGTDKITVVASGGFGPPGTGVVNPLTRSNLDKIIKINGVKAAAGRLVRPGKMEFNRIVSFEYAVSIPNDDPDARRLIERTFNLVARDGRLLRNTDQNKVVVGSMLGDDKAGFGKPIIAGSKVKLQDKDFTIIGVLKPQGNFVMDSAVIMNEDDMRDLFDVPSDEYDVIAIQIDSGADLDKIQKDIEKVMRKDRDVKKGEEDFEVKTPQQILGQVNSTLFAVQLFVYIIAGISILVGGIGIMNTMFTSVIERTRDIGIMKSIGARNSSIFILFFIESGLLGSVGGIIGAGMGLLLANGLALAGKIALGADLIQAHVSIWLLLSTVLGSFLLGSIFGTIPAYNASRLRPIDALRHKK